MGINSLRIIAVSSGKGGVGKTNFVANLALFYAGLNKRVLILDADLGLSNIDILFGLSPKYNLKHVLRGEKKIKDVVAAGPSGIKILPASSGVRELVNLTDEQKLNLVSELDDFDMPFDIFLIDTGAGISDNVLFFCSAAQETIVLITTEPTSMTDAYALIKILSRDFGERHFNILVNTARSENDALNTFRKLAVAADRFLNLSINYLGYLPYDRHVKSAIIAQKGFITIYPNSDFTKRLANVGRKVLDSPPENLKGNIQFFLRKALRAE
ncbi:MinD/ParA family protein [Thermodesulfovibrionales bacterium]|nr:MinD/ParA family protein [Thermodesulfovibrionales bacterium]MCL0071303.1 MinD/ParA family protein [Thermodesulfovibrionales bacterium]MCL0072379.1 MinD/ParA family protein [Thermodesulfovibrionales bacterium]